MQRAKITRELKAAERCERKNTLTLAPPHSTEEKEREKIEAEENFGEALVRSCGQELVRDSNLPTATTLEEPIESKREKEIVPDDSLAPPPPQGIENRAPLRSDTLLGEAANVNSKESSPTLAVQEGADVVRRTTILEPTHDEEQAAGIRSENRLFFAVRFDGREVKALFDPGASISIIKLELADKFRDRWQPAHLSVKGVTGPATQIHGLLETCFEIDGVVKKSKLRVMEAIEHALILGVDFCRQWNIEVRFTDGLWRIGNSNWKEFANVEARENKFLAECAGIEEIQDEQRRKIDELVKKILPPPSQIHGFTSLIEHHIDIQNARPFKHALRRMSPKILEFAQQEVKNMHEQGIIERSASEWCSAPVIVRKANGGYRFCVDYRDLNKISRRDTYPIPNMDTILDKLRKARFISKIDLKQAYHQILLSEVSRQYTAFAVPGSGLWQFLRMPFGLMNAPMTFSRLIDALFGPEVEPYVFGYLDDLIIVTETFEDHLKWLEYVLRKVVDAGLVVNREKCEFCCASVTYLGYRLDSEGLRADTERVAPVLNYPAPTNVKQLRTFLGMVGWYARFIKNDAELKVPLVKLLRKSQMWEWEEEQQEAFEALKRAISSALVLARPDFSRPFTVQCDASDVAIGAVLTQEDEDGEHPIVYISRVLNAAERNYTTTEKECLALLWAIKKLRPYIEAYHFTAVTDHSALKWLKNLRDPTGRLARWAIEMQQWDFDIVHKKGALNHVPDALSRSVPPEAEIAAFETITDSWYLERINEVKRSPKKFPDWKIEDGMLYRFTRDKLLDPITFREEGWRLVVPVEHRVRVLEDAHRHPSSGHLGVEKTYDRIARDYYWPGVYYDARSFVLQCNECQRYKVSQTAPQGMMGKRIVERPWSVVAADVMELPRSKSQYKYILVFQDLFTRWVELKPLRAANGKAIARAFEELILFRWETPDYLLTDNGTEFVNIFFDAALKEYGVKHVTTPPYHPQANPVERANRTLKTMIATFVEADHRRWDEHLHEFRHALNTAVQASTKVSPAFLNFGRHPQPVKSLRKEVETRGPKLKLEPEVWLDRLRRLDALRDLVRKHIDDSQARDARLYNRGRRHAMFNVGDLVMRREHALSNAIKGISGKLAPKYDGPFEIKQELSPTVYLLEDSNRRTSKVHVSELKRFVPPRKG